MKYVAFILLIFTACRDKKAEPGTPTVGVSQEHSRLGNLAARQWTSKGAPAEKKKKQMRLRGITNTDTLYHFRTDGILVKSYKVEDKYSSVGSRTKKEIIQYHLSGDTLVFYYGRPVTGIIRQLTDSLLVIDYPGHTEKLEKTDSTSLAGR